MNQHDQIPRIVITGAPGSGKTEFLVRLRQERAFEHFLFMDELARQLLEEDATFRQRWSDFHREIFRRQPAREAAAGEKPFVTDRGTVDAFAFHPETAEQVGTTIAREYARYSAVIQLGSAAGLGETHYRQDRIRNESIEEALQIERAIGAVWKQHPGYYWIDAEVDFESKFRRFRSVMEQLTGIARPTV